MTDSEFSEWAVFHGGMFSLVKDSDVHMFSAWKVFFLTAGVTAQELREATLSMAKTPPKWRDDHLVAINSHVRASRAKRWQLEQQQFDENEADCECDLCGNRGYVIVPHEKAIRGGKWCGNCDTWVVWCRCSQGFHQAERNARQEAEKPGFGVGLTLDQYETRYPQWKEMVAQHERETQALRAAQERSRETDLASGEITDLPMRRLVGELFDRSLTK